MQKQNEKDIVGVVGLGYVGIPLAVAFAKKFKVIGYDFNEVKINEYLKGIDITKEMGNQAIKEANIVFTTNPQQLAQCDYIIVAVPTPVDQENNPDTSPLELSSKTIGENMKRGCIVIYESTVYPGLTEEICLPILEESSKMKCGLDFKIAYSPERINPGDKINTFEKITKIVSGMDEETLALVTQLYTSILENGVYQASSIRVAEAAKVIENTQRDVNIAFMNELSKIFHTMGIDTSEVLKAAGSKWNFLKFNPGLVGGHCIGVDPFYLIKKSEEMGYQPQLLKTCRKINDSMGLYVADSVMKYLLDRKIIFSTAKVLVYGISFKENVSDIRNSKVIDIVKRLQMSGITVIVKDYMVNKDEVRQELGIEIDNDNQEKVDVIVFAVNHKKYRALTIPQLKSSFKDQLSIFDIKAALNKNELLKQGFYYWSL